MWHFLRDGTQKTTAGDHIFDNIAWEPKKLPSESSVRSSTAGTDLQRVTEFMSIKKRHRDKGIIID